MNRVYTIGEALIDFVPREIGCELRHVTSFEKAAGGAPANVACAVATLGGKASFIGKLGVDAFGDYLIETLSSAGVDTQHTFRTKEANTALAFVSLQVNGDREFSFYRKPSADMLLCATEIEEHWFEENDILHFGSVNLIDAPVKQAHEKAIDLCQRQGGIISFDPNVRLPLWDDPEQCRQVIQQFIPLCNLIKVSTEELLFITGIEDEQLALRSLFQGNVSHILYTRGADGAEWIGKNFRVFVPALSIQAIDTTGAGDAFVGAILYQIASKVKQLEDIDISIAADMLKFANTAAGLTTLGSGAIPSLVTEQQVLAYYANNAATV